jgi:hypothetical protein
VRFETATIFQLYTTFFLDVGFHYSESNVLLLSLNMPSRSGSCFIMRRA